MLGNWRIDILQEKRFTEKERKLFRNKIAMAAGSLLLAIPAAAAIKRRRYER